MAKGIYLDNNTTARPSETTASMMLPFFMERWGTPSAPHQMGQELFPYMEESYKSIYALLEATENDDFVFTSSGAEAVNHVILSTYFDVTRQTGKNQFITSNIDEAPSMMAIGRLEQLGCVGKLVHANTKGIVTAKSIAEEMTPRTALVSLSWANGMTGVINPIAEIAQVCKERGVLLHLDATHILGKHFYHVKEIAPDFITFNGDQMHAPRGTGGLYIKEGVKCTPFILGGLEQAGYRAGNLNVAALTGLGQAAKEALDARDLMCTEIARLRKRLETGIQQEVSDAVIFFQDQERLPHCTAIAFPGVSNEALLYTLNRKNLFASIGGGSFQQIALILGASGINETLAHSALNFSLSRETTEEEIEKAIKIIVESVVKLRKISAKLIE